MNIIISKLNRNYRKNKRHVQNFFSILHDFVLNRTHLTKHNTRIHHLYLKKKLDVYLKRVSLFFTAFWRPKITIIYYDKALFLSNVSTLLATDYNATFEQRQKTLRIVLRGIVYITWNNTFTRISTFTRPVFLFPRTCQCYRNFYTM